jgi:hypothetical protein
MALESLGAQLTLTGGKELCVVLYENCYVTCVRKGYSGEDGS